MVFFREKWKKCLSHIPHLTVRVDDIFLVREDCKRKRLIKEFTYHLRSNKKLWPQFKKGQMFIFCNQSHIPGVFNNCRRSFTHPGKSRTNNNFSNLSTILERHHALLRKGAKWK